MRKIELTTESLAAGVQACAAVLRAGGVAAVPTETVYGLVTLWDNAAGRQRIYELKRRPADKRLQMLAADLAMARCAGVLADPRLDRLAAKFWPGALTVVCAAEAGDTIGLRIPDHPFMHALLLELGAPLAATSANLSGEAPGAEAAAAVTRLDGQPDLVVDGGPIAAAAPSTVVTITGGELQILRPGSISESELRNALI